MQLNEPMEINETDAMKLGNLLDKISDLHEKRQLLQEEINKLVIEARAINENKPVKRDSLMDCIESFYAT